jgi:hypothetical protein
MYLPSNQPILTGQREDAARHAACSDQRIAAMRRVSAEGRARLFNTLVSPQSTYDNMGVAAAVNTQKLQNQTEVSRASGILGLEQVDDGSASVHEIIANAPEVVSLNRGGGCQKTGQYNPVPLGPNPTPGMPHRAPNIVSSPAGPMYYRGQDSTIEGDYPNPIPAAPVWTPPPGPPAPPLPASYPTVYASILPASGLSGIAPPWGDAWILPDGGVPQAGIFSWLGDNPWLALALAAGGVYALSRRSRR